MKYGHVQEHGLYAVKANIAEPFCWGMLEKAETEEEIRRFIQLMSVNRGITQKIFSKLEFNAIMKINKIRLHMGGAK